jgi:hypothetical protein
LTPSQIVATNPVTITAIAVLNAIALGLLNVFFANAAGNASQLEYPGSRRTRFQAKQAYLPTILSIPDFIVFMVAMGGLSAYFIMNHVEE